VADGGRTTWRAQSVASNCEVGFFGAHKAQRRLPKELRAAYWRVPVRAFFAGRLWPLNPVGERAIGCLRRRTGLACEVWLVIARSELFSRPSYDITEAEHMPLDRSAPVSKLGYE